MKLKNVKSTGKQLEGSEFADKSEGWTYLDLLLDETKEILAYIDVNLCYLHVNKAYADWIGLQKSAIIGKNVSEIIDDSTFKLVLPQFIKAFDGQHVYFNYLNQTHPIEIELIPNYKNDKNIMGCIWLVKEADGQNISEEISTFENLNATVTKLIELNSSKDKFFSIIAHDLKSPFNNILGFTDLLRSNLDAYGKDIIKQILDQLYNSSKMAYELLENLLDWSILQTERIKFEPIQFNFDELLDQCLPMLQLMASSKKISIKVSFSPDLLVFADQNHTRTVLRNLVSNAVKFSNENDIIYISAKKNDGIVQISIIDTGVGIPAKDLDKLFRIDTKYTTLGTLNERGTGLGLILCKDFVEKQGGKIWVESKEGEGSTFHFTLPC